MRLLRAISVVLLLAVPASAADLTFSLAGAGQFDTNVFRATTNEQWDFLFEFFPRVKLEEERETDISYYLDYRAPAEISTRFYNNISSVDQFFNAGGTWHANDRLTFYTKNNFIWANSFNNRIEFDNGDTDNLIINTQRDRVTHDIFEAGANYLFTPRLTGTLEGGFGYFGTTRDDRSTVWSANASAKTSYVVHPHHQLGGGFRYNYQNFSGYPGQLGSQTNNYYFFADWAWQISETLRFSVSAGPAVFQTMQDDTPPAAPTETVPFVAVGPGGASLDPAAGIQNLDGSLATSANEGDLIVGRFGSSVTGGAGCPQIPNPQTLDPTDLIPIIPQPGTTGSSAVGCPAGIRVQPTDTGALNDIMAPILLTNTNPLGAEDTSVTLFAGVALVKRWSPNLISALRYNRDQGIASGVGGSVVRDAVSLTTNWDFAERWELLFRGDWTLRQSESLGTSVFFQAAGVPLTGAAANVPSAAGYQGTVFVQQLPLDSIDTQRWGVAGELAHRLTKRTRVALRLQYNQQISQRLSLGRTSDFDDFLATLGVRHTWDPIHLW
jgi:hypothetical protein